MKKSQGQKKLEEYVDMTMEENSGVYKDLINGLMKAEKVSCSYEDKTITFAFRVQPWQVNRAGHLHGGMMCTALDMTMGVLVRFLSGKNFTPTVSLDVKYIRPVKLGDVMLVTVKAVSAGRRITHLICESRNEKTGKLLASGAGIFMNADTEKEKQKEESEKLYKQALHKNV